MTKDQGAVATIAPNTEVLEKQLQATGNPALDRVAEALRDRSAEQLENYSKMHHRHNRR